MMNPRLIYIGTMANLRSRYRNTWAGFLWVVLLPLITYSAQSYAFKTVLRLDIQNYEVFLLVGLLPWIFLQQCAEMCTGLIVNQGRLLKSFPVEPMDLIASQVLDNFFNFTVSFFILLLPVLIFSKAPAFHWFLFPLPLIAMLLWGFSLSSLLSILNVFLRDIRFVVTFAFTIGFFLTPIFYPLEMVPAEMRWLCDLNPIYLVIKPFQFLTHEVIEQEFWIALAKSFFGGIALNIAAILTWNWKKYDVYEHI